MSINYISDACVKKIKEKERKCWVSNLFDFFHFRKFILSIFKIFKIYLITCNTKIHVSQVNWINKTHVTIWRDT